MIIQEEAIITKLKEGKPISMVRCGDGEGILLNALSSVSAMQLANVAVLQRQMGYPPSVNDIEAIRANLVTTYNEADIIGIPCHKQSTGKHWGAVMEILNANCPKHTDQYCDIDLAYQLLENDGYKPLLQNRHVLNYISCRDLDEGFKRRYNVGIVNKYTIAPESKFVSGYNGDVHYPTQFNRVQRWMDVLSERHPGSLLLVGAGVIGKIYCNWWRDRGGIAFDIGGVADLWAGFVTRGPERGLDKVDNTHKL